jgi:hypothetical protein
VVAPTNQSLEPHERRPRTTVKRLLRVAGQRVDGRQLPKSMPLRASIDLIETCVAVPAEAR